MPAYTLKDYSLVDGELFTFSLLVIDGKCQFDEFYENEIKGTRYESEMDGIHNTMERTAKGETVDRKKFVDLTPSGDTHKQYEYKSKHLRVYVFHEKNSGRVIVIGAFKDPKDQFKDIKRLTKIKEAYFEAKKNNK